MSRARRKIFRRKKFILVLKNTMPENKHLRSNKIVDKSLIRIGIGSKGVPSSSDIGKRIQLYRWNPKIVSLGYPEGSRPLKFVDL